MKTYGSQWVKNPFTLHRHRLGSEHFSYSTASPYYDLVNIFLLKLLFRFARDVFVHFAEFNKIGTSFRDTTPKISKNTYFLNADG